MIDNSPIDANNYFEIRSSPFKRIMNNVKSFMKKNVEEINPSSFKTPKTEKSPGSNTQKYETYKKRGSKRVRHERITNSKEQKLPAKFKKGW